MMLKENNIYSFGFDGTTHEVVTGQRHRLFSFDHSDKGMEDIIVTLPKPLYTPQ